MSTTIDKLEVARQIRELVDQCERHRATRWAALNEANTRKDFILPLFASLGWRVSDSSEVYEEQPIAGGAVDYSFRLEGVARFLVEAKPLRSELGTHPEWVRQAVSYAYNKGMPWVVLTNFRELRVYSADVDPRAFITLTYDQYVDDFDTLWLLSKDSVQSGELDRFASKVGASPPELPVAERLFRQLRGWRQLLFSKLHQYRRDLLDAEIDEAIQRLFSRLIFIRSTEDRHLEEPVLVALVNQQKARVLRDSLWKALQKLFRTFDESYNSDLFRPSLIDQVHLDDPDIADVIMGLYEAPGGWLRYNFSVIDVDVLGQVYEQYLGYVATVVDQRKQEVQLRLEKGATVPESTVDVIEVQPRPIRKRSSGVYYTPAWVVDHLIDAVFDEFDVKTPPSVEPRILDPSCGSGSFLIKAFDKLIEGRASRIRRTLDDEQRLNLIRTSVFGVDLDPQAVEIARLNLLLRALESKRRLPPLFSNIKVGDSLVGSPEKMSFETLAEPFDWPSEFPTIFSDGGFDAIVGNPPWVALTGPRSRAVDRSHLDYYRAQYAVSAEQIVDTFALFIERSHGLLKDGGLLAFVLPDVLLLKNYPRTREFILEHFCIIEIAHIGRAFPTVHLDAITMLLRRESDPKKRSSTQIQTAFVEDAARPWPFQTIRQDSFLKTPKYRFNLSLTSSNNRLLSNLEKGTVPFGDLYEAHEGIHSGNIRYKLFIDSPEGVGNARRLIFGRDEIQRFHVSWAGRWVNYDKSLIDRPAGEYAGLGDPSHFTSPKLLVRRTGDRIIAAIDRDAYFVSNNIFVASAVDADAPDWTLDYITGLLNSSLMTAYFRLINPRRGKLFAELKIEHLRTFPIVPSTELAGHVADIVGLARAITALKASAANLASWDSEKLLGIEVSIQESYESLNRLVEELYGLSEDDRRIIAQLGG